MGTCQPAELLIIITELLIIIRWTWEPANRQPEEPASKCTVRSDAWCPVVNGEHAQKVALIPSNLP